MKKEGFGVLTTIDVRATLKQKLNVDFDKYVILGACADPTDSIGKASLRDNPPFAHQGLLAEEEVGLLFPCNVIVDEKEGKTTVGASAPMTIAQLSDNEKLRSIAGEVEKKIKKVLEAL